MLLKIFATLVATSMCFVQGDPRKCSAQSCVLLDDCPLVLALAQNRNRSREESELVRGLHCGWDSKKPKVCCPDTVCFTPDAQQGRCVSRSSCQHLTSLLDEKNAEKTAFVQASKCNGLDDANVFVCCGSQPPNLGRPTDGKCVATTAPPYPGSQCCGQRSMVDKIFGGVDASVDDYIWMALIEYTTRIRNEIKLLCGGSLISGRYVLTAGHCVVGGILFHGTPRSVRLGEHDTKNPLSNKDCMMLAGGDEYCNEGAISVPIEKIILHEDYQPSEGRKRRHDIALLRLTRMVTYTDFIKPVCLPLTDVTSSGRTNLRFTVAGWGAFDNNTTPSPVKQYVDVPFVNKGTCQPSYSVEQRRVELWDGHICAGGEKDKDSCKGDSGGPLMYDMGMGFEIVGVVSFGPTPCGMERVPGVYSKVFSYLPWIRRNIKP